MNNAVGSVAVQPAPSRQPRGQGGTRHRRHRRRHGHRVPGGVLQGQGSRRAHLSLMAAGPPRRGGPPGGPRLWRTVPRHVRPGAPADITVYGYALPDPAQRRQPRRSLGVRDLAGARSRRLRSGQAGRRQTAPPPAWTRPRSRLTAPGPQGSSGGVWRTYLLTSSSRRGRTADEGSSLPAGQAPGPRGDGLRPLRRRARFRGRLASREPASARGDRTDGRVRGGHEPHQGRLRRGPDLDPQRRATGGDLRHARRPRAGAHGPWPRGMVGAARVEGGRRPAQAFARDARGGGVCPPSASDGARDVPRRVRPPRRRPDRHRARGPLPKEGPDLCGRDRHADDGARRRDRRRRGAQLHGRARLHEARHGGDRRRGAARQGAASTRSTGPSS